VATSSAATYSADWVLPIEGAPIPDGAVVVEGGRITAVGPAAELGAGERFEGAAIVPGFVNAHTHLEYAVYAGFGDGLPFAPWLQEHIERKQRLEFSDMLDIARLGAAECLRSGITTVADYSYAGAAAVACASLGLRGIVYLEVFGRDPREALEGWERTRARVEDAFGDALALGVSPHAPYSCSEAVFEACAGLGLPLGTHLSESPGEIEWLVHGRGEMAPLARLFVEPRGETGVATLDRIGLLGPDLLAAHCVQLDPDEVGLVGERRVRVAHCPRSNALLGCGIAPVSDLRRAGAVVGIGTDSPASAPSLDLFEELRAAVYAARARERRPDALTGAEALELATLGGARALGLGAEIGSLVPGKRADLAVVSLDGSAWEPWEDPATAVVLGGTPTRVLLTVIDGQVRYRRDEFEWRALIAGARRARSRLLRAPTATRAPTSARRSSSSSGSADGRSGSSSSSPSSSG
jgi:cytosine/adenosine deaminase-related metal-dependent hydrolase